MEKALRKHLKHGKFQDVSPARSRVMKAVRGKNKRSKERRFRAALVSSGIKGWILRSQGVSGKPDFYFANEKVAVFVDGCFWHGCPRCGHIPKKNAAFWEAKIERNRTRDQEIGSELAAQGITVLRFWEHEIRDETDLQRHVDYVHYNPVKHGLVNDVADWPWSSYHRYVREGDQRGVEVAGIRDSAEHVTDAGE